MTVFMFLVFLSGILGAEAVNRVRLINHSSYAISVVQETMNGVEKFGLCNLKVEEVAINLNQTILGKKVLGEAKLKNGFVTTIKSLDVISSTVQQVWLSQVPGTVEVRSTLRLINMELGFDVETKISNEKYFSSAVILYPETRFAFNISKNLFTNTISVSVLHTMINPRTTLRFLPETNVSGLLPPLHLVSENSPSAGDSSTTGTAYLTVFQDGRPKSSDQSLKILWIRSSHFQQFATTAQID